MLVFLLTPFFFRLGETTTCQSGHFHIDKNRLEDKSVQNPSLVSSCETAADEVCVHTIVHDRNATAPPYLKFIASCSPPPKTTADCAHCHRESIIDGRTHNETEATLYEFVCCCREDRCSTLALSTAFGTNLSKSDREFFHNLTSTPKLAIPSKMHIGIRIALFVVYTAIAIGIQVLAIFYARRVKRKKDATEAAKKGKTNQSIYGTAR